MVDIKPRSSMDNSSSVVFHDTAHHNNNNKLQPSDSDSSNDPNLHMMGLGLSSQPMDWNQPSLLRGEKGIENSFRSMLQKKLSSSRTKPSNRGFSLDQNQFSPQYSSGDRLLGPDTNQQQQQAASNSFENRPMSFSYPTSYGLNSNHHHELMPSTWSKVPQFLRASPPKQKSPNSNQLHFTNNAPFWNASEAANIKDVRSSFFPSLQPHFSMPNFDVQPKNKCEVRELGSVGKKSGNEGAPKRSRNETPSPLPAFKVRKEKMGDRITALQQLVSPFGKTDTASVLSKAIEYIKLLHEQVTALSTPYMKTGPPIQIQQGSGKSKEAEGPKQDLRSRGLCLVLDSSTFPVTHESTVDFWTPTFGGSSR
ncbi:hypothetical protein RJT34_03392 [Clitoria ternatea]|uniref:BHLH domain-containing protein n=1 Tax=Clitoria ternatea TaxID=43366 RepID=A0AAN9KJQ4_CLITE